LFGPVRGKNSADAPAEHPSRPRAADIYPWYLADQYLDITNVPDGRYLLRVQIDAGGKLVEKTHDNNTAITCVDLHGEAATPCNGQISNN
jgi:hypothetical protein